MVAVGGGSVIHQDGVVVFGVEGGSGEDAFVEPAGGIFDCDVFVVVIALLEGNFCFVAPSRFVVLHLKFGAGLPVRQFSKDIYPLVVERLGISQAEFVHHIIRLEIGILPFLHVDEKAAIEVRAGAIFVGWAGFIGEKGQVVVLIGFGDVFDRLSQEAHRSQVVKPKLIPSGKSPAQVQEIGVFVIAQKAGLKPGEGLVPAPVLQHFDKQVVGGIEDAEVAGRGNGKLHLLKALSLQAGIEQAFTLNQHFSFCYQKTLSQHHRLIARRAKYLDEVIAAHLEKVFLSGKPKGVVHIMHLGIFTPPEIHDPLLAEAFKKLNGQHIAGLPIVVTGHKVNEKIRLGIVYGDQLIKLQGQREGIVEVKNGIGIGEITSVQLYGFDLGIIDVITIDQLLGLAGKRTYNKEKGDKNQENAAHESVFLGAEMIKQRQKCKYIVETKDGVATFYASTAAAWRQWLAENHQQAQSVWLIIYRKESGTPSVYYDEAVDEALCFGWVDSKPNKRDAESYYQYFSQRNPKSNWSRVNKEKVARLQAAGKMSPAGLEMVSQAKASGTWNALDEVENLIIPPDLQEAFEHHPPAAECFEAFPRSAKRGILEWIFNAKRAATRQKRIEETAQLAAKNIRANQYRRK
jgi:uncharacterized protein YdeI (YjbR/CyaY-like superfamily)